jgi:hypothetical protein
MSPGVTPTSPVATEALGDTVAALLQDLSAADISRLIGLLGGRLPLQDSAPLQNLLHTFSSAAAAGDATRAVDALSQIVALDPARADLLRTSPVIEPVRASVDQYLDRHTMLAKLDAQGRLEQASQQAVPSASEKLSGWEMKPATMVTIANRIFDAGGLPNYVRAAELAQVVIDGSRWAPAVISLPPTAANLPPVQLLDAGARLRKMVGQAGSEGLPGGQINEILRRLWLRAPLLIVLLAWLLLGITAGVGSLLWRQWWLETWPASLVAVAFQIWGIGFLALVAFGFYARVRKVRL